MAEGTQMLSVVTVGEAMLALTPPLGRLEDASALTAHVAGAELNFAIALSRLGVSSRFFGAVGEDPPGRIVVRRARAEGVDVAGLVLDSARSTGLLFKDLAGLDGERPVHYMRRASAASAYQGGADLEGAARNADGVHVSGISFVVGDGLRHAAQSLLDAGKDARWRSLDLNVRLRLASPQAWREVLDAALPRMNVLLCGAAELASIGITSDELLMRCRQGGVTLVLRRDHRVTEVAEPDGTQTRVEADLQVTVVDPVGAGDAFDAAVCALRLEGADWADAVRAGQAAGAMACRVVGDYEGAPYRAELLDFMRGREVRR